MAPEHGARFRVGREADLDQNGERETHGLGAVRQNGKGRDISRMARADLAPRPLAPAKPPQRGPR